MSDEAASRGIQRLIDKDEIHSVLMRYCRGVDRCDVELVADCYHEDAIDDHGDFILEGKDCADVFSTLVKRNPLGGMHLIGNCLIEIESDTLAFAESYFIALKDVERDGRRFIRMRAGRYIDRFEKRQNRWRIAERAVADEWNSLNETDQTLGGPERFRFGTKDQTDLVYAIRRGPVARTTLSSASEIKNSIHR